MTPLGGALGPHTVRVGQGRRLPSGESQAQHCGEGSKEPEGSTCVFAVTWSVTFCFIYGGSYVLCGISKFWVSQRSQGLCL